MGPDNVSPTLIPIALPRLVPHVLCRVGHDAEFSLAALGGQFLPIQRLPADLAHIEHVKAVVVEIIMRIFGF